MFACWRARQARGSVTVEQGGFLVAYDTEIRGSVSSAQDGSVILGGGEVRGIVTITAVLAQIQPDPIQCAVTITGTLEQCATSRRSAKLSE